LKAWEVSTASSQQYSPVGPLSWYGESQGFAKIETEPDSSQWHLVKGQEGVSTDWNTGDFT